jgi:hypothetical protein
VGQDRVRGEELPLASKGYAKEHHSKVLCRSNKGFGGVLGRSTSPPPPPSSNPLNHTWFNQEFCQDIAYKKCASTFSCSPSQPLPTL